MFVLHRLVLSRDKELTDAECILTAATATQDLPDAIRAGGEVLLTSLASRVDFQAHDIFMENPAKGADAFYLHSARLAGYPRYPHT